MLEMIDCYLSLGSNLGDRRLNLQEGIQFLQSKGVSITSLSSLYETDPVDIPYSGPFYNLALKARTSLSPENLLKICIDVEKTLGRVKRDRNKPRTFDADIIFYGDQIVKKDDLVIPHPRMHLRNFVLIPLAEIAPAFMHPAFKKTVAILLKECPDGSAVKKL